MNMPEGYERLGDISTMFDSEKLRVYAAMDLMKEMAEVLNYVEHNSNFDLLDYEGITEVLNKFKQWK